MSDFEKAIIAHLKSANIDKAQLGDLSSVAAKVNSAGLKGLRVFTKGIPAPDTVHISGIGDKVAITKLLAELLGQHSGLGGIHVFPYGIPFPDIFRLDVNVGPGAMLTH